MVQNRECHLLQIIDALGAPGCFASGLNGRQQEGHEDADDRDDNEEFDEREATTISGLVRFHVIDLLSDPDVWPEFARHARLWGTAPCPEVGVRDLKTTQSIIYRDLATKRRLLKTHTSIVNNSPKVAGSGTPAAASRPAPLPDVLPKRVRHSV